MIRVYIIVEGQTEESFFKDTLAPAFWSREVYLTPRILGIPGQKGGRTSYARVRKDVLTQLKQDPTAFCTTMLDYYGLGAGFPGTPLPPNLSNMEKVERIEKAFKDDICAEIRDLHPNVRFIPHLQLHEYESLLFSDPQAFATALSQPRLVQIFDTLRGRFPTPEDIDDGVQTAPSKRVLQAYPAYKKVIDGTLAGRAVGVEACAGNVLTFGPGWSVWKRWPKSSARRTIRTAPIASGNFRG